MADYPFPVSQLLTLGDPRDSEEWIDYRARGIGPEHVPDLICMVADPELNEADSESSQVWGPLHAWRALGELRAHEAVEPLLQLLGRAEERGDDWTLEELPEVFARIGAPALPALEAFLADRAKGLYARWAVADAIKLVARTDPGLRGECVAALVRELERAADNDPELNGAITSDLVDLQAVEAAPVIERAFAAGHVDESIGGDWPYVRFELGLGPKPPPRRYDHRRAPGTGGWGEPIPKSRAQERARAKRKEAKKARKRNRKKK